MVENNADRMFPNSKILQAGINIECQIACTVVLDPQAKVHGGELTQKALVQ